MSNDTTLKKGQFTLAIPDNGIAAELIQRKLQEWGFPTMPEEWCWDWKVGGKGEYVGSLPKRLGKYAWQEWGRKLSPQQLSEIGNLGSQSCQKQTTYYFDIVDQFDWSAGAFGDSGSCFWGCHAAAREMLVANGAFAIRFFDDKRYHGYARAWVIPWEKCYIVFNGYGLDTLPIARILATHLDHAYYRRVDLQNQNKSNGTLWINGEGTGYLVGPQSVVIDTDVIELEWEEPPGYCCYRCETTIDEEHEHSPDEDDYCENCFNEYCTWCSSCDNTVWIENTTDSPDNETICYTCFAEHCTICNHCDEAVWDSLICKGTDDNQYCQDCYDELHTTCDHCENNVLEDDIFLRNNDGNFCINCRDAITAEKEELTTCV